MDFAWEEHAEGKMKEEGGEVVIQTSFLTFRVGLKLHNKIYLESMTGGSSLLTIR